jgi:hypothetical protein
MASEEGNFHLENSLCEEEDWVFCNETSSEPLIYSPPWAQRRLTDSPEKPSLGHHLKKLPTENSLFDVPPLPPASEDEVRQLNAWRAKTTAPRGPLKLEKITVFAGDSFYRVDENGMVQAVDRLNHGSERQVLIDGVSQASNHRVQVEFQKLTIDKVGEAFLKKDSFLHWSTHGFEDRIGFEDAKRLGMEKHLHKEELKNWIKKAASHVGLIFISSCNTQLLGEAFVEAGIAHVVTCRNDSSISDPAAIHFSKIFWSTLASGRATIKEAFDIALQETTQQYGASEANKFVLLPEDRNHDVKVELPPQLVETNEPSGDVPSLNSLPPRPEVLEGREREMRMLCETITRPEFRCTIVNGPPRVGKHETLSETAHYIHERRDYDAVNLNPIQWFTYGQDIDPRHPCFQAVKDMNRIISDSSLTVKEFCDEKARIVCQIDEKLHPRGCPTETRTLVVLEVVNLEGQAQADKVTLFTEALLRSSQRFKVVIICSESVEVLPRIVSGLRCKITIRPLSYKQSLNLYGASFPPDVIDKDRHGVSTVRELVAFLDDGRIVHALHCKKCPIPGPILMRARKIFATIGNGFPRDILDKAYATTPGFLDALIALRKELDEVLPRYKSRAELRKKLLEWRSEQRQAEDAEDDQRCHEIAIEISKLEKQKESLKFLNELERDLFQLNVQIARARFVQDYQRAANLKNTRDKLEDEIAAEKKGQEKALAFMQVRSRCELNFMIDQLKNEHRLACYDCKYPEARTIGRKIEDLTRLQERLPTEETLRQQIAELEEQKEAAIGELNDPVAKVIEAYLDSLKQRVQFEIDEQARLVSKSTSPMKTPADVIITDDVVVVVAQDEEPQVVSSA